MQINGISTFLSLRGGILNSTPANHVRELQNEIQRAMIKSETDSLSIEDFLSNLKEG
jgi:transcriptional regulator with AAA-type ATPase domain